MQFRSSRTSFPTAGSTTIALPFTPVGVEIFVGPKGTTDTAQHFSEGAADGTLQNCISMSSAGTKGYNDRVISQWEAGAEVFRVDFTSFGVNQITFNVVTANSNYQAYMRYFG